MTFPSGWTQSAYFPFTSTFDAAKLSCQLTALLCALEMGMGRKGQGVVYFTVMDRLYPRYCGNSFVDIVEGVLLDVVGRARIGQKCPPGRLANFCAMEVSRRPITSSMGSRLRRDSYQEERIHLGHFRCVAHFHDRSHNYENC